MSFKKILLNAVYFTLSLLCLIYPALDNGYPLVYSDTGTYIASGFSAQVPVDRPIMYCFFVRHISMAFSLWLVIVLQAIICFTFRKIRDNIPLNLKIVALISFLGIVFNAAVCASFSMIANRFQGRIIWLIVLLGIIISLSLFKKKIASTELE